MAQSGSLTMKAAGADVKGRSSIESEDRAETIEFVDISWDIAAPREGGSGRATGRRTWGPLVIKKRVDRSSPLLVKALTQSEDCEAELKLWRPAADGTNENFFTVTLTQARVTKVELIMRASFDQNVATEPPYEIVEFRYGNIIESHPTAGTEAQDSWSRGRS